MGKIKKIKQDRKRAEVEKQLKKMRRNRNIIRLSVVFVLLGLISYGGLLGYRAADARYGLGNKVAKLWESTKKTTAKTKIAENNKSKTYKEAPKMQINTKKTYLAKVETTEGNFTIALNTKDVPNTVNNFVTLSQDGFYNNTVFHRIIKDFMIQGGDPKGDGTGGPGYKFDDEKFSGDYTPGTVAMANSGANTNGSQFFVMTGDYSNGKLPKNYTIFGKVTDGMATITKIAATPVSSSASGESSKPQKEVKILKVTIEEK
jgi:cyclophilin family peptidyl-prolyl cis-trans isomerase